MGQVYFCTRRQNLLGIFLCTEHHNSHHVRVTTPYALENKMPDRHANYIKLFFSKILRTNMNFV